MTEDVTNQFDVFDVNSQGLVASVTTQPSAGQGPFGMKFGRTGVLLDAEAASAAVSSYLLTAQNTLTVVSASVPDGQAASCWISLTGDGKFAFIPNTGSGTLSTYQVSGNGTVNLADSVTASIPGGAPIDSALSDDSAFLYVVDSAPGAIEFFRVRGAHLLPLGSVTALPKTVQGIAAL